MKKVISFILLLGLFAIFCSVKVYATEIDTFDDEIQRVEDSIDEDTSQDLEAIGTPDVESVISNGIDTTAIWGYIMTLFSTYSSSTMSALMVLVAVMLFASIAESYTYSLRYTDTKDIMSVVVGLFFTSVIVTPVAELVSASVTVIQGASTVMMVYLPVMAGIMAFSGRAITSGGYYAAVTAVSQLLSRIAASVLSPLLNVFLSLSISASICGRVRLGGLIESISKCFKYVLTFSMSIFVAVIGLNGALTNAADSVANKAVKFSLSSFIPIIGSSVSEAYGTIQGSMNILRSGIGVFVILAVFVAFAPLMMKSLLWSMAIGVAKTVGEALAVSSGMAILNALSLFLSALRAMLIAVMTVFIVSSSVMISVGGKL